MKVQELFEKEDKLDSAKIIQKYVDGTNDLGIKVKHEDIHALLSKKDSKKKKKLQDSLGQLEYSSEGVWKTDQKFLKAIGVSKKEFDHITKDYHDAPI